MYNQPTVIKQSPSWEADSHSASQEIPRLYGTWKFITVFTPVRHWSLYWSTRIRSTLFHYVSLRTILILPCLQIFRPKFCMNFTFPPYVLHAPPIWSS